VAVAGGDLNADLATWGLLWRMALSIREPAQRDRGGRRDTQRDGRLGQELVQRCRMLVGSLSLELVRVGRDAVGGQGRP
jgi:hypothetical protein